jgi:predicted phosphoribosyltransferase
MSSQRDLFQDRRHAGRRLVERLATYADRQDVVVLALPRGGVPVAFEVSRALHASLDVFVVRKLGVPGHEEYAMGAIASGGARVLDASIVRSLGLSDASVRAVEAAERHELERREAIYRAGHEAPRLLGRTVVVVDDGLATGATMRVAIQALRLQSPGRLVVAVPVGASQAVQRLQREADEVVCESMPPAFSSVGQWYADFSQTSDDEVIELLQQGRQAMRHEAVVPAR